MIETEFGAEGRAVAEFPRGACVLGDKTLGKGTVETGDL
jgi:hypothetical protein